MNCAPIITFRDKFKIFKQGNWDIKITGFGHCTVASTKKNPLRGVKVKTKSVIK